MTSRSLTSAPGPKLQFPLNEDSRFRSPGSRFPALARLSHPALFLFAASGCGADPDGSQGAPIRWVIERPHITTVSDVSLPGGAWAEMPEVLVLPDTTFLAFDIAGGDGVYLADRDGEIVGLFAPFGAGPGEVSLLLHLTAHGGVVDLFDGRGGRVARFERDGLLFIETVPMPFRLAGVRPAGLPDGSYVAVPGYPIPGGRGRQLQRVSRDGEILRSFGPPRPSPDDRAGRVTALAPSGDSAVWVGYADRYRIELWCLEGELLKVFEPDRPWPTPRDPGPLDGEAGVVPSAMLAWIFEDPSGLLWVGVSVEAMRHETLEGLAPDGTPTTTTIPRPDPQRSYHVADVFDLATGDLVASERWIGVERAWPMRSATGLLFQRFRTTDAGFRVVDVFGADLRER